ncbi:protein ATP6V1FNB [Canis lupus dingo]|uniref:protein ATP6V1FNB n=1 Tax=Canis lupus dingo TaxID=286419 RepID=UPI000DC67616|nr:protein ATP6V1FNB [Canis lupus dingo]
MRRAPPGTLKLLFQGISHDGQGRALYLRERHRQKPEEKFLYPVLSSWEYGWNIGDVMKDARAPMYARCQPIMKVFYIKSSVFHFPRRTDQLI